MDTSRSQEPIAIPAGTLDGTGAGDHDQPYQFGRRPRSSAPFPFSERQYARLLVLRGRVAERHQREDGLSAKLRVIEGGLRQAA
jgi:hypothetical protein